jgi:hypothetical protein
MALAAAYKFNKEVFPLGQLFLERKIPRSQKKTIE